MSLGPNFLALIGSLILLLLILELIRRRYLRERYSLLWIATGGFSLLLSIKVDLLRDISDLLGFSIPSNALFFLGILFLILLSLGLSVITSRLAEKNRILTQKVVLLERRVDELEKSHGTADNQNL
jgi:predicted permease